VLKVQFNHACYQGGEASAILVGEIERNKTNKQTNTQTNKQTVKQKKTERVKHP